MYSNIKISIIYSDELPIRLKSIRIEDIEYLRLIKNINKKSFFHKEDININQQVDWYLEYTESKDNWLYMYEEKICGKFERIGCLGFRINDDECDLYNIMRGPRIINSKAKMSSALLLLIKSIKKRYKEKITAKVVRGNNAINWYLKNNFVITLTEVDFDKVEYEGY